MPNNIRRKFAQLKEGKLTKSQKKLIDYFESVDLKKVIYMSITDLAAATGVAEATVLRFCRLLGFGGYQEFRLSLAQSLSETLDDETGIGFIGELEETYRTAMENVRRGLCEEDVRTAIELILSSRTVCCFGVGHSYLAALELHNRLMMMGVVTYCERDAHLQNVYLSSRTAEDLLIIFSVSGSSKDTVEAAELARSLGMRVLIVTCYEKSPLSRFGDLVLSAAPMDSPVRPGAMAGKIMQLFMVDVLCTGMHNADRVRFDAYYARSSRATVGKMI